MRRRAFKPAHYPHDLRIRSIVPLWVGYERWSSAREFLYGLKVAWVSIASVALGVILYLIAPQVQDLFLEVTGSPARSLAFWLLFISRSWLPGRAPFTCPRAGSSRGLNRDLLPKHFRIWTNLDA